LPELTATRQQLEAKFYHAPDFGVTEPRGAAGFGAYGKAIDSFVSDSSTIRTAGTYRGNPAILNYNPESQLVVVQQPTGEFVSGWQMSQQQLTNVIERGSLGGG
jgi:Colicin D